MNENFGKWEKELRFSILILKYIISITSNFKQTVLCLDGFFLLQIVLKKCKEKEN